MNPNRLTQVVIAPVISEKSTLVGEKQNQSILEILSADLTGAALELAVWGVPDGAALGAPGTGTTPCA